MNFFNDYTDALTSLISSKFASRLADEDASLWGAAFEPAIANRLGWVHAPEKAGQEIVKISTHCDRPKAIAAERVLLCGMGGSSLGPEVLSRAFHLPVQVLDTTHPDVLREIVREDLSKTFIVISSKSGTTVETISQGASLKEALVAQGLNARNHLLFVTDPNSPLADVEQDGYAVIYADPLVGGRFSVFTAFGLAPAILAGGDLTDLIHEGCAAMHSVRSNTSDNPALQLAAAIFAGLPEQFVLEIRESQLPFIGLGDWIEQLVAESTGKSKKGILPVSVAGSLQDVSLKGSANRTVELNISSSKTCVVSVDQDVIRVTGGLGAHLYIWEVATAALGFLLEVNPFDQPDVESAKIATREVLKSRNSSRADEESAGLTQQDVMALMQDLLLQTPKNGYLCVQAYLPRHGEAVRVLHDLRESLSEIFNVPVSISVGPRYLHSTGQLHKGGPLLGVFLQVTDAAAEELDIPASPNGYQALITAQADGDRAVLEAHGRPVSRIDLLDLHHLSVSVSQLIS